MRNACGRVVAACGSSWGIIGWVLFLGAFAIPMLVGGSLEIVFLAWLAAGLTLLWWVIDVVDQCVPWWIIAIGVVMLVIGTRAQILTLAAWVLYWTRVRE